MNIDQDFRAWLRDPEFHQLDENALRSGLTNLFDTDYVDNEFQELPSERQKEIRNEFVKQHEDFYKDINYKAASIYDRVAKTVDEGDKEIPAGPGGVMLMPDGRRLKWTGEDFESDTGKRVSIYEAALDSYDQQEKQRATRPESEKHGAIDTLGRGLARGTYQAGAATADWGGIIADRAKRDWVNLSEYGKAQTQASRAMDVGLDEIAGKTREIPEVDFKQVGPTALAEKLHGKSREWRDIARYGLAKDEDIQGAILDNPALLADLRWWADGIGEMAPSLASTIIPGVGAGKAIQVLGKGAKLTPAVVSRLVRFGSAISGGAAGGMFEGGSTYNELIEKGATEEQASRAATNMALASAVLNSLSVDKLLGKSKPGLRNKLVKYMRDGTWESGTETGEEPVEAAIKWAEGYATKDEVLEQLWNAPNVAPIAFVMGAGGSMVAGESTDSSQAQTPPGAPPDVQQDTAQGKEFAPVGVTAEDMLSGMDRATDAELQQALGRAREAFKKDPSNKESIKAVRGIEQEIARRQQAPAQPDALRNQANDLRVQLVKEPDEQKRAGLLDQLTQAEQKLQASGVQRTELGTPLQTPETVKPDTRPSATNELDALRQEEARLNQEVTDHHKRSVDLQSSIAATTNNHVKRMILMENLAAELSAYKDKFKQQARIAERIHRMTREQLPEPRLGLPSANYPGRVNELPANQDPLYVGQTGKVNPDMGQATDYPLYVNRAGATSGSIETLRPLPLPAPNQQNPKYAPGSRIRSKGGLGNQEKFAGTIVDLNKYSDDDLKRSFGVSGEASLRLVRNQIQEWNDLGVYTILDDNGNLSIADPENIELIATPSGYNVKNFTPTRGATSGETMAERGGVEASTARARQERTVSQPSAAALEAIDLATDYGVMAESEAKINSMPRKELNALAKSLGVDSKGNIGELRQRLLKRGVDPAALGIDRDAIRQRVEDALNNRKPPPPPAGPAGPSSPAPTTPKVPEPVGPSPQGTAPSSTTKTKTAPNPKPSAPSAPSKSNTGNTRLDNVLDANNITNFEEDEFAVEFDYGDYHVVMHKSSAEQSGKEIRQQQGSWAVFIKDKNGKTIGGFKQWMVAGGVEGDLLRIIPGLDEKIASSKSNESTTATEQQQAEETINDTQNQEGVRGAVPRGQEPGGTVQDQGPGREAPAPSGVLQTPGQGEVGAGTVSRAAGPKPSQPKQRKPRAAKPGKPLHDMKFSTWLADALYRITGKRGSRIDLPAPNVMGSHEFWTHADILDRYKHNDANARNRRKGELFISPARIREFTGLSPSQAKRNGDVDIQRIYDEFRADFPGFFPNVESEQNYGTDYEREAIKAFMDILKSNAPTILDAAKQNGVTILDESMLADELLEKHQSEEEAEFEAWLDEHPEARKRIEEEKAQRSRTESLSEDQEESERAIDKALEALQSEGYPADAINRDTVEILVDSGYTTDQILESFARDQGELDASFNPNEFEDAFSQAVDAFLEEKANPRPVEPPQETPPHLEPPDAKGNQQSTFVDYEEDDKGLLGGLFSRTKPVAAEMILQEAKDTLGTTEKLTEAGFVLPDGTLITVPQRGGKKSWYTAGHKWIASLIPSLQDRVSALTDFMEAGAIRIDYQPGGGSTIEIRGVPTAKQKAVLTRMIEGSKGAIPVDMIRTLPDGSLDMYSGWYTDSKTLAADAKSFAAGRLKMTGSLTQQFHQSDGTHWTGRSNKVQGMSVQAVKNAVAPLGYDIEVVNTFEDMSEKPLRDLARETIRKGFNVEGVHSSMSNRIFLFSSNIPSAKRAVEVALHEAIGHRGFRGALGKHIVPTLRAIADSKKYGKEVAALAEEYDEHILVAAEEWFAEHVEDGTIDKTLWSKFVGAFRNALRSMGIKLDFSEQDLKRLVRQAHKAAQRQGNSRGGGARFSAQIKQQASRITETPEFKRWFGDSKVVDENGEPLVVYHGTPYPGFTEFDTRSSSPNNQIPFGTHFTVDPKAASGFTYNKDTDVQQGSVYPVFLHTENILDITGNNLIQSTDERYPVLSDIAKSIGKDGEKYFGVSNSMENGFIGEYVSTDILNNPKSAITMRVLNKHGYDGIKYLAAYYDTPIPSGKAKTYLSYVSFEPNQIKSIFNKGTFSNETGDIRFSATKPATEYERLYNGLLEGGATPDEAARWVAEMGVTKDTPLSKPAETSEQPAGFTLPEATAMDRFKLVLQDRLARLEQAQKIVGNVSDDKDAYLWAELSTGKTAENIRQLEENHIDPILKRLVKAKLSVDDLGLYLMAKHAPERNARIAEKWADIEKIPKQYREIIDRIREAGSGLTDKEAADIIAEYASNPELDSIAKDVRKMLHENLVRRLNAGLITQEEFEILKDMFEFYVPLKTANEELSRMRTGQGFSISGKEIKEAWGRTTRAGNPFVQAILDSTETIIRAEKNKVDNVLADFIEANPDKKTWEVAKQTYTPLYNAGGDFQQAQAAIHVDDNVVEFKRKGIPYTITLHDDVMARGYKDLGPKLTNSFWNGVRKINNFLKQSYTTFSVYFWGNNFQQDIQTALTHVAGERSLSIAKGVVKDVFPAMRGIWKGIRGKEKNEWSNLYDEFRSMGAKTGWFDYDTVETKSRKLEAKLRHLNASKAHEMPRKVLKSVIDLVVDVNEMIESATRLAVYSNLIKAGFSKARAAQYAKNVTINFDKRGIWSNNLELAYMFSKVGIQGPFRVAFSLMKHKGTRRIALGMMAASFLSNILNRSVGDDDDWYDRYSPEIRDRFIFFPLPGDRHLSIRAAYGYNVFHAIGNISADMAMSKETLWGGIRRLMGSINQGFNPLGSGSLLQLATPTLLDPFAQIYENKHWHGGPVYREQPPYQPKVPDSTLYFKSARQESVAVAKFINRLTWGSEKVRGKIDINPETFDLFIDSYLGGIGKFGGDVIDSLHSFSKMEIPDTRNIPFVNQMVKEPSASFARSRALDTLADSGRTIFGEIDTQRFRDDMKYAFQEKIITAEQYSNYLRRFTKNQAEAKASLGKIKSERKPERPARPERTERRDRPERPTRKIGLGTRPPVTIGSFA